MQKTILKQNYENFVASSQEGLDKTYDKFQKLISQLEFHCEVISQEDANLKLLRILPSAWNNIALIMRNKFDLDTLSMDDLYNNLKVYESEIKVQSSSSSNSHNVAFVSSDNTSGTNETVNTAHSVFAASSKNQASTASYADDVMFSFFSNQSNAPQLDNEDLEQNSEVHTCSKECLKSYEALQKLYDQQREALNKSNLEIIDKTGLGYDGHVNESEVLNNVVDSCKSDGDDNQVNDMFKNDEGYHEVPTPYIGNYMPPRADLSFVGLDNYVFKSKLSETTTSVPKIKTNASKTSKDSLKKPKTRLGDGFEFKKKAYFVYGSNNHLIKDCDFYENKMVMNNKGKITGPKEIRPVWDNTARVNHQNKLTLPHPKRNFIPATVLTKSGQVPVNAAKQSSHRAASSVSTAKHCLINCDKKNNVLFTDTECVVLSPDSKLLDKIQVLLKVPRNNNMYSFDLKNDVPVGGLTGLFVKATLDESNLWHRRLGHINFKTMNKIMRGNLVRGLPSKHFKNNHTCVACQKGKQHKASCKTKTVISICKPLQLLHMDLFIPVSIRSINKKTYCLVVTDDFSRFSWVFFLATKDKTFEILKSFIAGIENQMDHKVRTIICDNETEFKNMIINEFFKMKDIRKEFSVARTPQKPTLSFMRPFGCPVTILNTLDHLGTGPNWMFDIDTLTMSMNYQQVFTGNQTNGNACTKANIDVGQVGMKTVLGPQNVLLPLLTSNYQGPKNSKTEVADDARKNSLVNVVSSSFTNIDPGRESAQRNEFESMFGQDKYANGNRMFTLVSAAGSTYVNLIGSIPVNAATLPNADLPTDPLMPDLEDTADLQDTRIFSGAYDDEVEGAEADFNKLELTTVVSPIPKTRIHKDHPKEQIVGDLLSALQTKRMTKTSQEHAMIFIYLKGQPKLGLWYPRDSPFDLKAFLDTDYAGASHDRKSTTGGCQFLRKRLISWQCKKQTVVANSTTKAEYVVAANCYGQIQALVDKKKVIITEALIRRDLRFEDEGRVDCLSNEVIFEQLTLMGTMASTIICLATNQKFNFSKYIFDNMVKHLDGGVKFLMYPRFVQVFLDNQVEGMDRHNAIFVISSHKKKVFANMKREGKDFSGKVTPLFATMMVQASEDMGEALEIPTDKYHTPIVTQPSSSLPQKKQKYRRKQRKEIKVPSPSREIPTEEGVPITSNDPLPTEESKEIGTEKEVKNFRLKRLRKVGTTSIIESSTEASLGHQEDTSKKGRTINSIDQDVKITLVDETQGMMKEEDMFGVNDLDGDEMIMDVTAGENSEQGTKVAKKEVSTVDLVSIVDLVTTAGEVVTTADVEVTLAFTTPQISKDELTLAQTLIEIRAAIPKAITTAATTVTSTGTRPKAKGIMMQEPSERPTPTPKDSSQKPSQAKDKGKGKMVEPEKPLKRKDQIMIDKEFTKNLKAQMQAELEKVERLARLKEKETNIALIES
nr:putative ribonuclease H-like domain-containing protein [Tanacetum cinerariifolium]